MIFAMNNKVVIVIVAFLVVVSAYLFYTKPIHYINNTYNFTLDLTYDYKGYYVEDFIKDEGYTELRFTFNTPKEWPDGKFDVFRIIIIPTAVFEDRYELSESEDVYSSGYVEQEPSLGKLLGRNDGYVFVGTRGHDCAQSKCKLYEEAFKIMSTFKLTD